MCEAIPPAKKLSAADWQTADTALQQLEHGIAVLYSLARDNADDEDGGAILFTARAMREEVERAQMALGFRSDA